MKPLQPKDWMEIARPGSRLFIGSGAGCPQALVRSMLSVHHELKDIELVHILTLGETPWVEPKYRDTFRTNSFFLTQTLREAVKEAECDYTPCFLSEVPALFLENILPLDAALVMVSPPDAYGYCSLGVNVDVVAAACRSARRVVAQINPRMPFTNGESFLHVSQIHYALEYEEPLPEWRSEPEDPEAARKIGDYVAQLIEDGSTLQLGIGHVPNQVCYSLMGHRHLGIHTEMFSDGVMELFLKGVVDNTRKTYNQGKMVAAFCMGSEKLYQFVNGNQHIRMLPTESTNNIANIARNDKMVAINSAFEVDLTGQVAAESVSGQFYSGIGGIVDFMRGAALSKGGLPIIALPSTARGGTISRIVPQLTPGGGVVGSRADVHFVVTEYGIATLRGRSLRERALELIQVAHPDFREDLLRYAYESKLVPAYQKLTPLPVSEIGGVEFQRVTLRGEEFILRPLHPSDERRIQEFFYSHTPETVRLRYGHPVNRMSRDRAYGLVSVNQQKDLALAIFEVKGPRQRIHAIGRYYLDEDGKAGEVAVVVREEMRRYGMGSLLIERMTEIARRRHLKELWALVAPENEPMLRLFRKLGWETEGSNESEVRMRIKLRKNS